MKHGTIGLVVLVAFVGSVAQAAITMVDVGNAGNLADNTGYGSVAYNYQIGKFEVTAGQYTEFLNAVARTDTYGLYNTGMLNTMYGSGITQTGSSGSYSYSVNAAFVNRPVNYVSFYDAARFTNWLTTGNTESGVYSLSGVATLTGILDHQTAAATLNVTTAYFIPTEDEWYKAAYHKNDGLTGNYFEYATSSDTAPGRDMNDASGNNANWRNGYPGTGTWPIDSGKHTTVAGEFQDSDSPYGTFDQAGNLWEWDEALIQNYYRGLRSGCCYDSELYWLQASFRHYYPPTAEQDDIGFRVASSSAAPEPSTLAIWSLLGVCGIGVGRWRRRKLI